MFGSDHELTRSVGAHTLAHMRDTSLPRLSRVRSPIRRAVACALVLGLVCLPSSTSAQDRQDEEEELVEIPDWEWPSEVEAPLRTLFEREDVEAVLEGLDRPSGAATGDIATLAATLGPGVEGVFRYVQRRIRYEPYVGSIRGAAGTLRAGGGNAIDQALLLRELLAASGYRSRFARGRLDWASAVLLTGETRDRRPPRGDPWLRQVEAASDHWWIEVRDGGRWVAADPVFVGAALGDEMAPRRDTTSEVPTRLVASARLELTAGGRRLGGLQLPVAELFGTSVQVLLASPVPENEAVPPLDEEIAPTPAMAVPSGEGDEEALAEVDPLDAKPVLDALPVLPPGPIELEIRAAGRVIRALPVGRGRLGQVRLDIDIEIPPGRHVYAALPFGVDPFARLTVVVAGGEVRSSAYADPLTSLYVGLEQLAAAELVALEAWRARPDDEEEVDPNGAAADPSDEVAALDTVAAEIPPDPGDDPDAPVEPQVHPAVELHLQTLHAWNLFADQGLEVIALALLGAADQLRAAVPLQRAEIRIVGLHYRPGRPDAEGGLTAWISDPARVGGAVAEQRAPMQMALGLLQSAVVGQVLNHVADRPPMTAYDLTLRAVGSGSRLSWFRRGDDPPDWPAAAVQMAAADLDAGRIVVGPGIPIRRNDEELLAWWSIGASSGMTSGRIQQPMGIAQAAVALGPPVNLASLNSVLASLHDLHVAMRWLLTLGAADGGTLRGLVPGACAATPLVADLLRAGAPPDFVPPAFAAFCQPTDAS